jgi:hypothetical protein
VPVSIPLKGGQVRQLLVQYLELPKKACQILGQNMLSWMVNNALSEVTAGNRPDYVIVSLSNTPRESQPAAKDIKATMEKVVRKLGEREIRGGGYMMQDAERPIEEMDDTEIGAALNTTKTLISGTGMARGK